MRFSIKRLAAALKQLGFPLQDTAYNIDTPGNISNATYDGVVDYNTPWQINHSWFLTLYTAKPLGELHPERHGYRPTYILRQKMNWGTVPQPDYIEILTEGLSWEKSEFSTYIELYEDRYVALAMFLRDTSQKLIGAFNEPWTRTVHGDVIPVILPTLKQYGHRTNVEGVWAHVINSFNVENLDPTRETDKIQLYSLLDDTEEVTGEVCVSSVCEHHLYHIHDFIVSLIFRGTCSNVFTRDVYSDLDEDGYRYATARGSKRTEGWLVPDESELLGVSVNGPDGVITDLWCSVLKRFYADDVRVFKSLKEACKGLDEFISPEQREIDFETHKV